MRQFFFAAGFVGLIGIVTGLMLGLGLCTILISATTSPFVPESWRPTISQVENTHGNIGAANHSDHERGTSFQHPLIGPAMVWSVVVLFVVGLIAGSFLSFFPDEREVAVKET